MSSRTFSELAAELSSAVAFPGRLRLFCDPRLVSALPSDLTPEWSTLAPDAIAAAACGAAVAEAERGGQVLVVAREVDGGTFAESATLAGRLGLDNLHVVLATDEPALVVRFGRRSSDRPWGQPATSSVSLAAASGTERVPAEVPEWPPVHLAAVGSGGRPGWPIDASASSAAAAGSALAWLAEREPRLFAVHLRAGWSPLPPTRAQLYALAHLCSEGRRVAWMLPRGTSVAPWLDALMDIGRRRLALKFICHVSDLPSLAALATLDTWWIAETAGATETAAVLAQTLDTEDSMILALDDRMAAGDAGGGQPWQPGSGRWLEPGSAITIACRASTSAAARKARDLLAVVGIDAGVFQCTSLLPLPSHELRLAAARAPMLAIDDGDAAHGLGAAIAWEIHGITGVRFDALGAIPGGALAGSDVAQAARALIAN